MRIEELKPNSDFLMSEFQEALNEKGQAFEGSNRFSKEEYLCEGGCKKLFVVRDLWTKRQVVKAVPKDDSPENIELFIYESQLLASLEHPNILPVYDVGSDNGNPFILMKLMEGDNLRDFLSYDPPLSLKLKIFEKICDAVSYCHKNEIVHLDLKPENIQVSPQLEVTVCDWGSAKRFADLDSSTLSATPGYVAPEVFEGQLSHLCDIYSLGVLFYEILSQKRLFSGKDPGKVLKANKRGKADLFSIKDPSLKAICRKALELKPEKRFADIDELQGRLNLYHQKLPVPEENAGFLRTLDLLIQRHPMAIGLTTIFFTFTSIAALMFAMSFNQQKNKAEKLMNQYQQERDKAEKLMNQYQQERDKRVALSLDNSKMLHNQAWQAYKGGMLDEALQLLKLSVSSSGYDEKKYELEGLVALLQFDIPMARSLFQKAGTEENYSSYFKILPVRSELVQLSVKELTSLIMKIRKTDSYFYHRFIGSIYTLGEFSEQKKEEFINAVTKALGFSGKLFVSDKGKTLEISGNAGNFPTYILRAMRLKKLVFKNCRNMPNDIRTKEINDCVELEELDLRGTGFTHLYLLKNNNIRKLSLPARSFNRIDHLQSMPLEEIYMVKTRVKSLMPLLQIKTLKTLTLSQDMTKLPGYKELAEKITIKIKK